MLDEVCSNTNCGKINTASRYIENVQKTKFLLRRSPGYAVIPQTHIPLANSASNESGGQSPQQFVRPGGPANLSTPQFPQYILGPFQTSKSNLTNEGKLNSDPKVSDTQMDAQTQLLQHQIEVLQNQLQLLQRSKTEQSREIMDPTKSLDNKEKDTSSSSSKASESG